LVSLEWMPQRVTASAIPIGGALIIIAEALRLPQLIRDARGAGSSTLKPSRRSRMARRM
jgi:TRAP-type C4-dicarboxylate transport system permease small subunit